MAATLVGIYHSICGKESYLISVNILQTMAVAICNSFKHASVFSVEVPTHPKEVEDPPQRKITVCSSLNLASEYSREYKIIVAWADNKLSLTCRYISVYSLSLYGLTVYGLTVYGLAPPHHRGMAEQLPQPKNQQQDQPVPQPRIAAVSLKLPPFWRMHTCDSWYLYHTVWREHQNHNLCILS